MPIKHDHDNSNDTVFIDIFLNLLAAFSILLIIIVYHINPDDEESKDIDSPGNLTIELRWPDESTRDLDLWAISPNNTPVGYKNKNAEVLNLLRDDLGTTSDLTGLNYEFIFSRGIPEGRYAVNVNLYSKRSNDYEPFVEAIIVISIKKNDDYSSKILLQRKVKLNEVNKEVTIFQFEIDKFKNIVRGSVNTSQINFMGGYKE